MLKSLLKPAPLTLAIFLCLATPAVLVGQPGNRLAELPALLAVLMVGGLLVLYLHELGHVAGGLLSGYRFVALYCGPLVVSRAGERLKAAWNDLWALYPGATMMAPRGGRLPSTRDAVALYAGGPLASLIFGVLCMAIHFGLDLDSVTRSTIAAGTHTLTDRTVGDFTLMAGVLSLAIVIATSIPNALGGFLSDGAAVRMLFKGGPEAERLLAMNALVGQLCEGIRPRHWSPEYIRSAVRVQDGSTIENGAASCGLLHALDQGDVAAARAHLARMKVASEKAHPLSKGELQLADAWLALADGRLPEARAAFEQTEKAVVDAFSRRRVLAAILLVEGKADESRAAAREGLALLEQSDNSFAGASAMDREWLEQLAEGRLPAMLTRTAIER